jgi:hypothetical protein
MSYQGKKPGKKLADSLLVGALMTGNDRDSNSQYRKFVKGSPKHQKLMLTERSGARKQHQTIDDNSQFNTSFLPMAQKGSDMPDRKMRTHYKTKSEVAKGLTTRNQRM